ncbi:MAG TPA: hypothetical protein VK610_01500 [Rhodothermales bacterium]|nr:hypothetical protein [Rhodothermales bacterium]
MSRRFLPLALALFALPAAAQPAFRLASPVVVVDGVRAEQAGLVLEQPAFRFLTIAAPGYGRFVVSDRMFTGARRAGEFDGTVLALTIDGRSVRLRGAEPLLATRAVVPAYARFDADPAGRPATAATVRFAVAGAAPTTDAVAGTREIRASGRGLNPDPAVRTAATDNRVAARLSAEIERLDAEVARLQAEVARLQSELSRREGLRPAANAAVRNADAARADAAAARAELATARTEATAARADANALRAERDRLREDLAVRDTETRRLHARVTALEARLAAAPPSTDTEALRAELALARGTRSVSSAEGDSLRAELARVGTENARAADRAAADVAALRAEVDRLDAELHRITAERDALRSTVGASTSTGTTTGTTTSTGTGTSTSTTTTTGTGMAEAGGPGVTTRTTTRGPLDQPFTEGRLAISLPNFDHSRLRNVEEVRGVMANALLPVAALEGHGSGDVLMMFVTDTAGNVVQTEVTESVTPTTDAVAQQIVRAMKIVPPTVEGQNAILRSQVRVRFSR